MTGPLQLRNVVLLGLLCGSVRAQQAVVAHIQRPAATKHEHPQAPAPALFWLEPVAPTQPVRWTQTAPYRLLQKNKMFTPHLLVVPVGAVVSFPNADPFFHNVFSLFNGKRFDLGLYEAGTSKDIHFEREGVSYIFCNIHPGMSAVVISLQSPLWSLERPEGTFAIQNVPPGEFEAHLWVEGEDERKLNAWTHRIKVPAGGAVDAGSFGAGPSRPDAHTDKFGQEYKPDPSTY